MGGGYYISDDESDIEPNPTLESKESPKAPMEPPRSIKEKNEIKWNGINERWQTTFQDRTFPVADSTAFYKVIDITDTSDASPAPLSRASTANIKDQSQKAVRVILEGLPDTDAFPHRLPQPSLCVTRYEVTYQPKFAHVPQVQGIAKDYNPAILRTILNGEASGWFTGSVSAYHGHRCHQFRKGLAGWWEHAKVALTTVKTEERYLVICYVNKAALQNNPGSHECATATWRWLRKIEEAITTCQDRLPYVESTHAMLEYVILEILSVTLRQNADFLERLPLLGDAKWHHLSLDIDTVPSDDLVNMSSENMVILRSLDRSTNLLRASMDMVIRSITRRSKLMKTNFSRLEHLAIKAGIQLWLEEIAQYSNFHKADLAHHIAIYKEQHAALAARITVKQATSVSQLTLLAAFFLPLSLSAAILSMQTRFMHLHLLLYDFLGVMLILGALAAVIAVVNRYGTRVWNFNTNLAYGAKLRKAEARAEFGGWPIRRATRFAWIGFWWCALLASFLVGMLMDDAKFGLRILGFEAAGILLVWVSIVWGLRWYVERKARKKSVKSTEKVLA